MGKVAVVTGGNRGIGFGLVEVLCHELGPDAIVYMGVRDPARGRAAVARLEAKGLAPRAIEIDIASDASVDRFAGTIAERHGGYDIFVGNAGLAPMPDQHAQIDEYLNTNNFGTDRLIRHARTLLRDGARYLTVASRHGVITEEALAVSEEPARDARKNARFGATSYYMAPDKRRLFYAEETTLPRIEQALHDFAAAFKRGTAVAEGWPDWINIPSKAAQVASTLVFAREMEAEARRRDILINACCPGFVETDATRMVYDDFSAAATPLEAAADLAWIVTRPPGTHEPYGRMIRRREMLRVHD